MKNNTMRFYFSVTSAAALSVFSVYSHSQLIIPAGPGWGDSYSADGQCYCSSTYDHGIGDIIIDTPAGIRTVIEVCEAIGPGPGRGSNPVYNTIQCGHGPVNDDVRNFLFTDGVRRLVSDEIECPGRVDLEPEDCNEIGPTWDLSVFGSSPLTIPGRIEAEDYTSHNGTSTQDTDDVGGGQSIGSIQAGDYLSYAINVEDSGTYELEFRVASPHTNTVMTLSINDYSESIVIPNTGGWENWASITHEVNLNAGQQTLQLDFSGTNNGLLNINWIDANSNVVLTELDSTNWALQSSVNNSDVYNTIDDDDGSRWTSGEAQQNGQTFTVDFNDTLSFDRIVLDSTNSPNDQPRGYAIHVSNNGSDWGSPIITGEGNVAGLTTIDFADQNARFIRITQTGSATNNWWSIHELSVFTNSN